MLSLFVPAAQKQNDFVPILTKEYAVTLALMYPQFTQSGADGLNVAKVTELQSLQPYGDLLLCSGFSEPLTGFVAQMP